MVTLCLSNLKTLHFICKWDEITDKQTKKQTDRWTLKFKTWHLLQQEIMINNTFETQSLSNINCIYTLISTIIWKTDKLVYSTFVGHRQTKFPTEYLVNYCIQLWVRPVLFSPYRVLKLIRPVLFSPYRVLKLIRPVLNSPTPQFSYIILYI